MSAHHHSSHSTLDAILLSTAQGKTSRDYWNIDDILAEEESTPCIFKEAAHGLAFLDFLDQENTKKQNERKIDGEGTLAAGKPVKLPLWLAISLAQRRLVELKPMRYLTNAFFNTLKAGSEVVTFRTVSPYIYENVIKMSENMNIDMVQETLTLYQQVFIDRFSSLVLDHSNNSNQQEQFDNVMNKLSILESDLFSINKQQKISFQAWKNNEEKTVPVNKDFIDGGKRILHPSDNGGMKRVKRN